MFTRQLVSLLKAGVPLLRSLDIIGEQLQNPYFKEVVKQLAAGIRDGQTFSDSLTLFPRIYSSLYVTMVRAGEEGGSLKEILYSLAQYQRNQEEISSKVRSALAYPVLMAVVGFATVFFILTFVMPRLAGLFTSAGESLPWMTVVVINISHFLQKTWLIIVFVIILLVISWQKRSPAQQSGLLSSPWALGLPWVGEFIKKVELARFSRTLELLLKCGISILRALQISIPVLNNELLRREFAKCQEDLASGSSFGNSLKNAK